MYHKIRDSALKYRFRVPVVGNGGSGVLADVRTLVLLILLICLNADSQMFYFGVKGGTPLSPSTSSAFGRDRSGSGLSTLNIRRYTVGPTFELALPFRLRFEADALYKRLDRTEHRFLGSSFGN